MTTEQAIETLRFLHNMCDSDTCLQGGNGQCEYCSGAVDMAIKALEKVEHLKQTRKTIENTDFLDISTKETVTNNEEVKMCMFYMFAGSILEETEE